MSRLQVNLLGGCVASVEGAEVRFSYDKLRALLAFVLAEGKSPLPRSQLAGLLWPDQPQREAEASLRQGLSRLRRLLGDRQAPQPILLVDHETVQVNPAADASVDIWELQNALDAAARHRHRHPRACSPCAALLRKACDLYRGDFLSDLGIPDSDIFEAWSLACRENLLRRVVGAFENLLSWYARIRDASSLHSAVSRLLQVDPWNEAAHAGLLRLLASEGQKAQAIRHFQAIKARLKDELGIEPSPELAETMEKLLRDEALPEAAAATIPGMPVPVDPIVGRGEELSRLRGWLNDPDTRLITVTGLGGVGKTRLAIAAVEAEAACFDDSALFLRLDAVGTAWHARAAQSVHGKDILLVLDGFEHVMKDRLLVQRILVEDPRVVALVSSRAPLSLPGETVLRLEGLALPPPGSEQEGEQFGAVELFLRSARQRSADFRTTPSDSASICEICRFVDGLPLAINLAAGWVGALSCAEIAAEIQAGLDILAEPSSAQELAPGIRSVFDQSLRLLAPAERRAFPLLSVFRGGFDKDAAVQVAEAGVTVLAGLVMKSLVHRSAAGRYYLHDLIRMYGEELLKAGGAEDDAGRRHAQYFLQTAESKRVDPGAAASFADFHWLVTEQPNLHAALQWSRGHDPASADRLAALMRMDLHGSGVHLLKWLL